MIVVVNSDCKLYFTPFAMYLTLMIAVTQCSGAVFSKSEDQVVHVVFFPSAKQHSPILGPVVSSALPTPMFLSADVDGKSCLRNSRSEDQHRDS